MPLHLQGCGLINEYVTLGKLNEIFLSGNPNPTAL